MCKAFCDAPDSPPRSFKSLFPRCSIRWHGPLYALPVQPPVTLPPSLDKAHNGPCKGLNPQKAKDHTMNNTAVNINNTVTALSLRSAAVALMAKATEAKEKAAVASSELALYKSESEKRLTGVPEGFYRLQAISKAAIAGVRLGNLGSLASDSLKLALKSEGKSENDAMSAAGRVEKLARETALDLAESLKSSGKTALAKVTFAQLAGKLAVSNTPGAPALHAFASFVFFSSEAPRLEKAATRAETEATAANALATQAEANEVKAAIASEADKAEADALAEIEKARAAVQDEEAKVLADREASEAPKGSKAKRAAAVAA